MAKYASGNQEKLRLGFIGNNENDNSLKVVGRTGIGTTVFDADRALVVRGDVSIGSATTFSENLVVEGTTRLTDSLTVAGISTFAEIDVNGHTELDNLRVSGVSTLGVTSVTTFTAQSFNVTGSATFGTGTITLDGNNNILNVGTGVTITSDNIDISGIITASQFHTGADGSAIRINTNTISGPAEMFIDPSGVGDNTGILRIRGDLFVDGTQTQINSTTIELADFIVGVATTATSDLLADGAGIGIGSDKTFLYEYNSGTNPSLKSSENLNVASGSK